MAEQMVSAEKIREILNKQYLFWGDQLEAIRELLPPPPIDPASCDDRTLYRVKVGDSEETIGWRGAPGAESGEDFTWCVRSNERVMSWHRDSAIEVLGPLSEPRYVETQEDYLALPVGSVVSRNGDGNYAITRESHGWYDSDAGVWPTWKLAGQRREVLRHGHGEDLNDDAPKEGLDG